MNKQDTPIEELVFDYPSGSDVAWEHVTDDDQVIVSDYRGDENSIYDMSLEEQFMLLCFVVQSEDRSVSF